MRENLYYDRSSHKPLCKEDGCTFENWHYKHADFPFALHPNGFPIFLGASEIMECDEYSEGDPHGVASGLEGEFQKNRIACTIDLIEIAAKEQPGVLKILDIGCGEAHVTSKIREILPNAEVCGLDHSLSAIITAVSNYSNIDFCVANAYHLPYRNDYFDIVVCNNVWEHIVDPVWLLSQISIITKPNGYLIISTPNRYRFGNLFLVIMGKTPSLMATNHVTEYTMGQIIEQLRYGKYKVVKTHSNPMKEKKKTIQGLIGYNILYPILNAYLRIIKSHHRLEKTVFFLARKNFT